MDQTSFQNGAKNWGPPSALGEPNWGTPSAPGEPNWGTPSAPGGTGSWDAFVGVLDRLGGVLEASWRGLGGLLGGLRPRKVANMAPTWLKTEPKSIKNRSQN